MGSTGVPAVLSSPPVGGIVVDLWLSERGNPSRVAWESII